MNTVNVFYDVFNRAQAELCILVQIAEGAAVPRAVPAHADQQAAGFTGRADAALFKSLIGLIFFHGLDSNAVSFMAFILAKKMFISIKKAAKKRLDFTLL